MSGCLVHEAAPAYGCRDCDAKRRPYDDAGYEPARRGLRTGEVQPDEFRRDVLQGWLSALVPYRSESPHAVAASDVDALERLIREARLSGMEEARRSEAALRCDPECSHCEEVRDEVAGMRGRVPYDPEARHAAAVELERKMGLSPRVNCIYCTAVEGHESRCPARDYRGSTAEAPAVDVRELATELVKSLWWEPMHGAPKHYVMRLFHALGMHDNESELWRRPDQPRRESPWKDGSK